MIISFIEIESSFIILTIYKISYYIYKNFYMHLYIFWSLFYRPFQTIIVQKQHRAPFSLLYFLIAILAFILRELNDFTVILEKETLLQDFSGNEMLT